MLIGSTIGNASPPVWCQDKIVWTSAGHFYSIEIIFGTNQAKMRTSSILILARIVIITLAQWVINLDVVGSVSGVPQDGHVLTSKFIGFNYGFEIPVSPV
jgi:hypothetical protein